ncbi:MAG: chorismate mutase [Lentisphaeria bacterium]|nr:chorismate mutase [Lentisphaeria bacterium]
MDTAELDLARKEIDRINDALTDLLVERMKQVDMVAHWKSINHQPVVVPDREKVILDKVSARAGEKYAAGVREIFKSIIAVSCAREVQDMTISEKDICSGK